MSDQAHPVSRASAVSFTDDDCTIFERYPERVKWEKAAVPLADQTAFRRVRKKLDQLVRGAEESGLTVAPLKPFVSVLQPNGRTPEDMWCCLYPEDAPNKSYALQVALIISADGAELCLCLGSGTSQISDNEKRRYGESYLQRLQNRMRETPAAVTRQVMRALPADVKYLVSWRRPSGASDFQDLGEWLVHAGSPGGTQASISRYFSTSELVALGGGIVDAYTEMLQAAAPLLDYCFSRAYVEGDEPIKDAPTATLDLATLKSRAEEPPYGLRISDDVYRAVVAAIRSGKHLILTGPPGTAKTTLAEILCQLAQDAGWCQGHTLTTATADWTTYETIGGLRPSVGGAGLRFYPGLFLESLSAGNWLIVDELNRSNFDRAFGQMFTVLSGQSVVLPFEDHESGKKVVLAGDNCSYGKDQYSVVKVSANWRIIATMNVFDKTLLFEMSYALMRRFAFVEVPAPDAAVYESIWRGELAELKDEDARAVGEILGRLEQLRAIKQFGPAVFKDMARFARHFLEADEARDDGALAFQMFYSFLLPQFEGIDESVGRRLYRQVLPLVGDPRRHKLEAVMRDVLGVRIDPGDADDRYDENA